MATRTRGHIRPVPRGAYRRHSFVPSKAAFLPQLPVSVKKIPEQSDWTDDGIILSPVVATWEDEFTGATSPCWIVETKSGKLILGYIGNSGARGDGGPADRALGIATSTDGGDNWSKSGSNPVVVHQPNAQEEEGIWTSGARMYGSVILAWFGAMTDPAPPSEMVDDDIKFAMSKDEGVTWTALTTIIANTDTNFVGADAGGAEIDPLGVTLDNGKYKMYYQVAGSDGLIWAIVYVEGDTWDVMDNTSDVLISDGGAGAHGFTGGADPIYMSSTKAVAFLTRGVYASGSSRNTSSKKVQVVSFNPSNSNQWWTERWYNFTHMDNQTTFYSNFHDKWFMVYLHHSSKDLRQKRFAGTADTGILTPIAQYHIDEAASGQSPTEVVDDALDGENLAISYDGANPSYVAPSTGRGLDWATDTSNGIVSLAGAESKVKSALEDTVRCTLEFVTKLEGAASGNSRLFGIQNATESGRLAILASPTDDKFMFYWGVAGETLAGVWNNAWNETTPARSVYHLVIDTTLATAADRVVLYKDGSLFTKTSGTNPSQFDRIELGTGEQIIIGNREGLQRALIGEFYYAAFYGVAMTASQVSTRNTTLTADDDDLPAGGGVMGAIAGQGGLAGHGGIAGKRGGLAA